MLFPSLVPNNNVYIKKKNSDKRDKWDSLKLKQIYNKDMDRQIVFTVSLHFSCLVFSSFYMYMVTMPIYTLKKKDSVHENKRHVLCTTFMFPFYMLADNTKLKIIVSIKSDDVIYKYKSILTY